MALSISSMFNWLRFKSKTNPLLFFIISHCNNKISGCFSPLSKDNHQSINTLTHCTLHEDRRKTLRLQFETLQRSRFSTKMLLLHRCSNHTNRSIAIQKPTRFVDCQINSYRKHRLSRSTNANKKVGKLKNKSIFFGLV